MASSQEVAERLGLDLSLLTGEVAHFLATLTEEEIEVLEGIKNRAEASGVAVAAMWFGL